MQMTIDVPDTLPQERIKQRIQALEQTLTNDVMLWINHVLKILPKSLILHRK